MAESYFQKLHSVASTVQKDVDFIRNSLNQPRNCIPSHVGSSGLRSIESDLKALAIDMESAYYDVKNKAELCSNKLKDAEKGLSELQTMLDNLEMRLQKRGPYQYWRETTCKDTIPEEHKVFVSPIPVVNKRMCSVTPIAQESPKTEIVTPMKTVASSTPCNVTMPKHSKSGGFKLSGENATPEDPLSNECQLYSNPCDSTLFHPKTPESPVIHFFDRLADGLPSTPNNFVGRRLTPEEPLSRDIIHKQILVKRTTPEEPFMRF